MIIIWDHYRYIRVENLFREGIDRSDNFRVLTNSRRENWPWYSGLANDTGGKRARERKRETHGNEKESRIAKAAPQSSDGNSTLVSSLLRYCPFRFASPARLYRNREILIKDRHSKNMFLAITKYNWYLCP